jgi:hypothetical protein
MHWLSKRDEVKAMVKRGLTVRQIAQAFRVSEKAASMACFRLGISVPRDSKARRADPGAGPRLIARINRGEIEQIEAFKRALASRGIALGDDLVAPE